jgi:cell wall assembly regulator SMI1
VTHRIWHDLIRDLEPAAEFSRPVSEARLSAAELRLGVELPEQLRSLLSESDGVAGEYGLGLVWSLDRIVNDNRQLRAAEDRTRSNVSHEVLFFGDAGDGELFGHPIARTGEVSDRVVVWNPIEDSRTLVADGLRDYIERWLSGTLAI